MLTDFQYIFILGCPRSGTSLLQVMLERHPDIIVSPETKLFYYVNHTPKWLAHKALQRIEGDMNIKLPGSQKSEALPNMVDILTSIATQYKERLDKPNASVFCEKSNEHSMRVEEILRNIPNARFIVLTRDGRDVAASLTKVPWAKIDSLAAITVWRRYVRSLIKWQGDDRFIFVCFEDLVSTPETTLSNILAHCNLAFDKSVLHAQSNMSHSIPQREIGWKARAVEPIDASRAHGWKQTMSLLQVAPLEQLAQHELGLMGYPLSTPPSKPGTPLRIKQAMSMLRMLTSLPFRTIIAELTALIVRIGHNLLH